LQKLTISADGSVDYGTIAPGEVQTPVFSIRRELWAMLILAAPMAVAGSMRAVVFNTDTIYLGQLGDTEQAGATIGENLTEMASMLYCGFTFTLTPLVAGCAGSANPEVAGHYTQLCMTIVLSMLGPMCLVFYFYTSSFYSVIFDTDPKICAAAQLFNNFFLYGVVFLAILQVVRAYASGLGEPSAALAASVSAVFLNIAFNQTFIFGLEGWWEPMGFRGSPLASSAALFVQLAVFSLVAFGWQKLHLAHSAWEGLSRKAYSSELVGTFVGLAIPNVIGALLEVVGFRTLASLGSSMGTVTSAALACMVSIEGLYMVFAMGLGEAITVRISQHMSKGDPVAAKKVLWTGQVFALTIGMGVCCFMHMQRFQIVRIYSSNAHVQERILAGFPALQTGIIMLSLLSSAKAGMYAMCRSIESALISIGIAWFVLIPFAVYFGFYTTGLPCSGYLGVMWACPVAYGTNYLITQYLLVFHTNWSQQVGLSRQRSGPTTSPTESD